MYSCIILESGYAGARQDLLMRVPTGDVTRSVEMSVSRSTVGTRRKANNPNFFIIKEAK
jgi:hypothetical protein